MVERFSRPALGLCLHCLLACSAAAGPLVRTPLGLLRGFRDGPAEAFFGVRYAPKPPRFGTAVLDTTPWSGERTALQHHFICWEPRKFPCIAAKPVEECSGDAELMSEDCLFLDIWRPRPGSSTPEPKAVMVTIHGGSMTTGSSSDHNASLLAARQDIIVVAVNYRLGPLGFLPLRPFGTPGAGTGGMNGIHDQLVALQWVQANIASFGGDPSRVTLQGVSAGALSVCTLSVSPLAQGLFVRSIMESGPCIGAWGAGSVEHGAAVAVRTLGQLGVRSQEELLLLPPWAFQWPQGEDQYDAEFPGHWVDGWLAPEHPRRAVNAGRWNPSAILLGSNSRDGIVEDYTPTSELPFSSAAYLPAMELHWRPRNATNGLQPTVRTLQQPIGKEAAAAYPLPRFDLGGGGAGAFHAADGDYNVVCPAARLSALAEGAGVPAFLYYFVHGPLDSPGCPRPQTDPDKPGPTGWAGHGDEVKFLFMEPPCDFTDAEWLLADILQTFWATFAKTGTPLYKDLPLGWPRYGGAGGAALRLETGVRLGLIEGFGTAAALLAGETVNCDFWKNVPDSPSVLSRMEHRRSSQAPDVPDHVVLV